MSIYKKLMPYCTPFDEEAENLGDLFKCLDFFVEHRPKAQKYVNLQCDKIIATMQPSTDEPGQYVADIETLNQAFNEILKVCGIRH